MGKEHDHLLSTLKEYIWIVTASSVKGPMSKMAEKRKHYTNFQDLEPKLTVKNFNLAYDTKIQWDSEKNG